MSAFLAILARDLRLGARVGGGGGLGAAFLLMVVAVTPFALGPDLALLARTAPGVIWLGALLATLAGLDRLFQADAEDGTLALLRAGALPLPLVVLAKGLAHWLATGLPLALAAPPLGLMMAMEPAAAAGLGLSLALGTPALTFLGAVGAAVTASLRRGGLLLALVVLPLSAPVLVFGVAAARGLPGNSGGGSLLMLAALDLFAVVVGCAAAAAALGEER